MVLDSQHPEGLQQIRYLEDSTRHNRNEWVEEVSTVQPRFLTQMKDQLHLKETQNAHFECRIEPVADSDLRVEWFKNGQSLTIGRK